MSWRVPDSVRLQIANEPAFLGNAELASKYGVSYRTIGNTRRQHGVKLNPRGMPLGLKIRTVRSKDPRNLLADPANPNAQKPLHGRSNFSLP